MFIKLRSVLCGSLLLLILSVDGFADGVSFSQSIAPILLDNCQSCHGAKKAEGGYRVDTFQQAIGEGESGANGFVAENVDDSEAFRRLVSDDATERMPLDGDPLSAQQVQLVRRWIQEGAVFDGDDPTVDLTAIVSQTTQPDPPISYQHNLPITALRFSHDGRELFAGGYHEVTVWDLADGSLSRRIKNQNQRIMGIDVSPDGKRLAVGGGTPGREGAVRLVEISSGHVQRVMNCGGDLVMDVQFSPNGERVAASSVDSGWKVFRVEDGIEQLGITSHSDWVTAVAWSPDGAILVTGSRDKTCKVFDAKTGELKLTYSGHGEPVRDVVFHPGGAEVYSAGNDNKIHRWKIADGEKSAEMGAGGEVFRLAVDGAHLFAASADGTVRQFDVEQNKEIRQFQGHQDWPLSVDVHAATDRLASGGYDGEVRIWDPQQTKEPLVISFSATPGLDADE